MRERLVGSHCYEGQLRRPGGRGCDEGNLVIRNPDQDFLILVSGYFQEVPVAVRGHHSNAVRQLG